MTTPRRGFYVAGGTLPVDAPSYVRRRADEELYHALREGEFCYVLHSRQMGKSSLMVRTAARLRAGGTPTEAGGGGEAGAGARVVILDLAARGQNVTPEQWYAGLLMSVGEQLDLEDELDQFWEEHPEIGPLERWMRAIREVALAGGARRSALDAQTSPPSLHDSPSPRVERGPGGEVPAQRSTPNRPEDTRRLIIFIDEIDAVRSTPFSTDEFFAAIRECYNRRTQDPAYENLTFCLLGVATPSDLVKDPRTTPFNIGRRIELTDFTPEEAAPLAEGLTASVERSALGIETEISDARRATRIAHGLLRRVLYWTGGHPYFTQRLCRTVAESPSIPRSPLRIPQFVDGLCQELFLSGRGRERDSNLLFVRDRLLKSEADLGALLDLYDRIRRGQPVINDERNPLVSILRLSGIVKPIASLSPRRRSDGALHSAFLRVRNRIYARVFNRGWVAANMPGAELRRQRAAYRRGAVRAGLLSATVLAVFAALVGSQIRQVREAEENLYAADMRFAQQAAEAGDFRRVRYLLRQHEPSFGRRDLRDFTWRYLRQVSQPDDGVPLVGHTGEVLSVTFSPAARSGTRLLASGGRDGTVRLWDASSGRCLRILTDTHAGRQQGIMCVAFSPDGALLAASTGNWSDTRHAANVILWRVAPDGSVRQVGFLQGFERCVNAVQFSPDGRLLATGDEMDRVRLFDLAGLPPAGGTAPPGRLRVPQQPLPQAEGGTTGGTNCLAFSRDTYHLAAGSGDGTLQIWDLRQRSPYRRPAVYRNMDQGGIMSLCFSRDGRKLVVGTRDGPIRLWSVTDGEDFGVLSGNGHRGWVYSMALAADGNLLATGSGDTTIRLWDLSASKQLRWLKGESDAVRCVALSGGAAPLLAAGTHSGDLKLWRVERPLTLGYEVKSVVFSPAAGRIAVAAGDRNRVLSVFLWDGRSQRPPALTVPRNLGSNEKSPSVTYSAPVFSTAGALLLAGAGDNEARVWNLAEGSTAVPDWRPSGGPDVVRRSAKSVALSPGGRWLAISENSRVRLFELPAGPSQGPVREAAAPGHPLEFPGAIRCLAFSPDGAFLAAAGAPSRPAPAGPAAAPAADAGPQRRVMIWEVKAQRPARWLIDEGRAINPRAITCLAFALRAPLLAAAGEDRRVFIWNWQTGRLLASPAGHYAAVNTLAFTPDGKTLASGGQDRTVKLWNVALRQEVATLTGYQRFITSVAFSPDGNTLAVGSNDQSVSLLRAAPP